MRKTFLLVISLCIISFWIVSASAGGPVFWRVNTRAEIERGDARGVSIADNGSLTLAPALIEVFDTKQAYIWSVAADKAGNIYLGTGHEGRVFKVDPSGKGTLLYKTSELDVMSLAVDAQGNVYAGTSPDGKIYRIAPSGEAKVFFEPNTKYIWSLAFDGQGRLLVGTGDKGVIYRVNADGTGAPFVRHFANQYHRAAGRSIRRHHRRDRSRRAGDADFARRQGLHALRFVTTRDTRPGAGAQR